MKAPNVISTNTTKATTKALSVKANNWTNW